MTDPIQEPEAVADWQVRLGASEYACYRWQEDTAEHRAMRAAFCDGASHARSRPVSLDLEARKIADKVLDLVVGDADAVFADDRNDLSDRRSIRAFADRYRNDDDGWRRRAILALIEGRT